MFVNIEDSNYQPVDLTSKLKPEHQGKWVVMSRETRAVFAYDKNPKLALQKASKAGCKDPILHKALPFDKGFISHLS